VTLPYPHISPVILRLGPIAIRWYGVMYAVGYIVGIELARLRTRRGLWTLGPKDIDALVGYLLAGMFAGARLTYVFLYDWPTYRARPLEIFAVWNGGLSFHGAAFGMAVACAVFAVRRQYPWLMITDGLAVCAPPGLFAGRLGNFINGELYGRPTTVAWAMRFPADPAHLARHPSQLYEAIGEGLVLGLFLWWLQARLGARMTADGKRRDGYLSAAFVLGYSAIRFVVEFTRQPDAQLGLIVGPFSMGQLLSALMALAGLALLLAARRRGYAAR
jgi:phosphatidylglycerol:prolipoprotein diacylglycerol transferase